MLDYDLYKDKSGTRFAIVNGDLVEDPSGALIVSNTLVPMSIYLNSSTKTASLVIPRNQYIGREYKLRANDCITLCAEWLDSNKQLDKSLVKYYANLSNAKVIDLLRTGLVDFLVEVGFHTVNTADATVGDLLLYNYKPEGVTYAHIGVYLGNEKILHHIPKKLSSIDTVDGTQILGVYRYG